MVTEIKVAEEIFGAAPEDDSMEGGDRDPKTINLQKNAAHASNQVICLETVRSVIVKHAEERAMTLGVRRAPTTVD